jgi:O-antigen/teichoic acid export membrane protein
LNPIRQLAGQTAVYGLSSVIARILNYFLVPLYTRVFNTGEYGVVTELYAYVAILMVVLTYGLETGYFRFAREKEHENGVFSTAFLSILTTSFTFVFLVTIFAGSITGFLGDGHRSEFVVLLAFIIGIDTLLAIPYAQLRQQKKSVRFAFYKTINIVTNIVFNIFFLLVIPFLEKKVPGNIFSSIFPADLSVGYIFLSNLIASALSLVLFLPTILKSRFSFSPQLFANLIKYSFPLLIAGLGGIINETIDRVILKFRLNEIQNPLEQLGIYGANIKIAVFMTLFVQMYRYAAEPFFFNQHRESEKSFLDNYSLINRIFIYIGLFVFLGIVFFLDIFKYFIGIEFREGIGIVPLVLFSNLLLGVFFNLSFWYKLYDRTWYGAYLTLVGAIITIGINYFFIPVYGYFASAWAHVICNLSMVIISYYYSRKVFNVDFKTGRILAIALIAAFFYWFKTIVSIENYFAEIVLRIGLLFIFITAGMKIEKVKYNQLIHIFNIKA